MLLIRLFVLFISHWFHFQEEKIFQITLNDIDDRPVSFSDFKKNKATVFVFLMSDCPASQDYTLTLNKLADKYRKDSVFFKGVFPGDFSAGNEMKKFKEVYKINFQLLKDPDYLLAKKLNATVVPGCFLIDQNEKIIYQGRIDDWLYALGKKRQVIKENNLDAALKSMLKNLPVKKPVTTPIGCILEYEKY
jgi:peroxiredoxin